MQMCILDTKDYVVEGHRGFFAGHNQIRAPSCEPLAGSKPLLRKTKDYFADSDLYFSWREGYGSL